jgi:glycine/D-amino acid oxidase-like deaminating enzyme
VLTLGTVHKAKGLEFDVVEIGDDFPPLLPLLERAMRRSLEHSRRSSRGRRHRARRHREHEGNGGGLRGGDSDAEGAGEADEEAGALLPLLSPEEAAEVQPLCGSRGPKPCPGGLTLP